MIGIDLKLKAADSAQGLLFNPKVVKSAADRTVKRVMNRFGAFVRQRAKTSIRNAKGVSRPGGPPSSHLGLVKKFVLFAYDEARQGVIIGPILLNRGDAQGLRELEEGGSKTIRRWGERRRARYRARPFMRPAFEEEIKGMPRLWAGAIK